MLSLPGTQNGSKNRNPLLLGPGALSSSPKHLLLKVIIVQPGSARDHLNLAFTVPLTTPPWVYLAHTCHWAYNQDLTVRILLPLLDHC